MITITKVNEVFLKISAEKYILQELNNYFTFDVDGARFSPAFKQKLWNGKKHLFNGQTRTIYVGLYSHILEFAEKSGYTINEDSYKPDINEHSIETVETFVKEIVKPASQGIPLETRDYQINGIHHCVSNKRATILSPTSCHKKGDKILMSNGKFKNIEDITVDDYVIGNDGKHKKVLRVFTGENAELYDIIPRNSKNKKIPLVLHQQDFKFYTTTKANGVYTPNWFKWWFRCLYNMLFHSVLFNTPNECDSFPSKTASPICCT